MGGHIGQIGSSGALQHQGNVWLDRESGAERASCPHFFLNGKDKGGVHGQGLLEQLCHHGTADSVVDGLGLQKAVAELRYIGVKDRHIAQMDVGTGLLFVLCPDVDGQFLEFRDLFLLVPAGQVIGFQADDAGELFRTHQHGFSQ